MPKEPLPWLLQVARRVLANSYRSERRRRALQDRALLNERSTALRSSDLAEDTAASRTLIGAIRRLPERDREALMLIAWEDLTTAQAARVMECSPATFAVRIHRARKRLRKELARAGHLTERGLKDAKPIREA